ncbi:pilus assembly protein [Rhodobium gokarnense]|uniref:Flp pilus assembly protein TadG n=1 Tax=Rhodobium gokarnense TaxID=364296 RepID=A0ABT3HGT1_9HYPH|nr:pilus assembly protein [Rhodobium gokarnense]MCW2309606.1 Flp pilus assembly protein TadG [Rhodobium gokarnense]
MLWHHHKDALVRHARRFVRDTEGNFAVIFAACLLPLLLMIGMATDYTYSSRIRNDLQVAVDAATLAATKAASAGETDLAELKRVANESLHANFTDGTADDIEIVVTFDPDTGAVKVVANTKTNTAFMKLAHFDTLDIQVEAEAVAAGANAEVAMVLDVTGSMGGSKISNLKTAAKDLVDTLLEADGEDKGIKVSMVPYAYSVNIGKDAKSKVVDPAGDDWEGFLENLADVLGVDPDDDGHDNGWGGRWSWGGGWDYRTEEEIYYDDVVDKKAFRDTYSCVTERGGAEKLKDDDDLVGSPILDMTRNCPNTEVVPLTTNPSKLKTKINTLNANGGTAGHIGLAWGWYTISPTLADTFWPSNQYSPAPYEADASQDEKTLKVLVLMTDGEFNTQYLGDSSRNQALDLCDSIKAKDVLVYTVGFQAPSSALQMLKQCATKTSYFFDANSGSELIAAFNKIAAETKKMRLSM